MSTRGWRAPGWVHPSTFGVRDDSYYRVFALVLPLDGTHEIQLEPERGEEESTRLVLQLGLIVEDHDKTIPVRRPSDSNFQDPA